MSKIEQVKIPIHLIEVEEIEVPSDLIMPRVIKLTKHRELEDAVHPHNIEEGFEIIGQYMHDPVVNASFWLKIPQQIGNGETMFSYWRTSVVTEIIGPKMFKTMNSVYIWEDIEE